VSDPGRVRPQRLAAALGHIPRRGPAAEALLSVRDLRAWFFTDQGVAKAVDGVSFDVLAGETLGIVGESGCGKTVTSLSLLGLLPRPPARIMDGSSIRFRGEELVGAQERRLRALRGNDISMIFQEPMSSLNPVRRVGSQITEPLRVHRGMPRKAARAHAIRLLEEVGIPEPGRRVDEYPHQLSGGMRQRVMIAMALACEPRLLIADEPTTALDVTIQAQILELLAQLRESHNMSVLLITHDLGVVAEVCDRVIVMYAGQVVEQGTVHQVFAEPAHPYTRALLDALPSVDDPGQPLVAIPGTVPSPSRWPEGCRFEPRCRFAASGCERPQDLMLLDSAAHPARVARCWRAPGGLRAERVGEGPA
jgi:peptide/nickel transport system ATP-binding protein/oligopeptide transport system ATP-binding protein